MNRIRVKLPKKVKKWCGNMGLTPSSLVNAGIDNVDDTTRLQYLSSATKDWMTTITLSDSSYETFVSIREELGMNNSELATSLCLYTIIKLGDYDNVLECIIESVCNSLDSGYKIMKDVYKVVDNFDKVKSELSSGLSIQEAVAIISTNFNVSELASRLAILYMLENGKLISINGEVRATGC